MPEGREGRLLQVLTEEGEGHLAPNEYPVPVRSSLRSEHAALESLRQCHTDLERYLYLRSLREKSEAFFFQLLIHNAQEILPYVYTPTVGEACEKYSHLPIRTGGLYITPADKGNILERLKSCPWAVGAGTSGVRVIVITDGERILGLGDLGYGGMGISEGKILLYSVIAGVDPAVCLPVCLDVGTNNKTLLEDPQYKGLRHERLRGAEYDALVAEFMEAVRQWQPHCLVQFEDFGNTNAFRLLERYRTQQCCFNDDIQGTACIVVAGLFSALRITGGKLADQKILFLGAGEAGTGIGQLIAEAVVQRSGGQMSMEQARECCLFVDSKGLVCKSRVAELQHHKLPFAHDVPFQPDLLSAVHAFKPTMLVGVSTQPGAFTRDVIEAMAKYNARPIIFPLSNPTSKSECTYKEAYTWTNGRVVFASGSPFPSLRNPEGDIMYPSQANNAYIFGPVGKAALMTKCCAITDGVFLSAAEHLAELTPESNLRAGMLFPSFSAMKTLVVPLIARIARYMVYAGLGVAPGGGPGPSAMAKWEDMVQAAMYRPDASSATTPRGLKVAPKTEVDEEEMKELVLLRDMYTDLQRYLFLRNLQERDPGAFWRLIMHNAQEILPWVYTPTVGEACQKYCRLPLHSHGIFLSIKDKGSILARLKEWPHPSVRVIVITDGERILGLGDLGYGGMGISEGKILLYSVIAGVDPSECLPVCLDVGTNNKTLLEDPEYKGLRHERLRGAEYDALVAEFMEAVRQWQPHCLVQFEDFGNTNAFRLLERYRTQQCCFNDDIQGTACIALCGILSALRVTGGRLEDQKILFLGAGEAGTGIGQLIAEAVQRRSMGKLTIEQARECCLFVDSKGLVCKSRAAELQHHKLPFAHDVPFQPDLLSAIRAFKPTALVGVSTQPGAFSKDVLGAMEECNARPIIFPLSNPTSKSECTFKDAYTYTHGAVVFASGSPFPPFTTHDGITLFPAQANNAYVFGPIGMAALLTRCQRITDGVFMEAAETLARMTPASRLSVGMLFPAFADMKVVAPKLIAALAQYMVASGIGTSPDELRGQEAQPEAWEAYVSRKMYQPPLPASL